MSARRGTRLGGLGLLALAAALTPAGPASAACDCSSLPSLGRALDWPALGIGDILVELQGAAFADGSTVAGNVGVTGLLGTVHVQGDAGVEGQVGHPLGATVFCTPLGSCPAKILGGIVPQDMSGPAADAIAASAAMAALSATQSYGSLSGSTTISGNGCINVIEITGDVDLGGNSKITLSGSVDDYFVVNVTGDLLTSGTADILLEGVDPHQVIFNLVTPGARAELGGNSGGNFTILNPAGEVYLHGNAGGRGAYYAGAVQLLFQGNSDFAGEPFACGSPGCPDPELTGATTQSPATPQGRSLGNTSFFHAYFDLDDYEGHLEHFRLGADGRVMGTGADASDVADDNEAIDPVTQEFKPLAPIDQRKPYWDAATPLLTDNTRTIYTTIGSARDDFDISVVTEAHLALLAGEISAYPNHPASGITTLAQLRAAVIAYLHGLDAFDEDGDTDTTEIRDAVLGVIFHSNPQFIGTPTGLLRHEPDFEAFYQAYQQRDRVVYAGANDGIFHAFDAGSWYNPHDPSAFDPGTGEELFGYVPGLLLDSVKLVPRTVDVNGERLAPKFVDGAIVAADAKLGANWTTALITSFREGGEGYLALDVTDPAAVAGSPHHPYPKLLWEFSHTRMGESWSRPVITRVRLAGPAASGDLCGRNDGDGDCKEQWVAIFAAGYTNEGDPNRIEYIDDPTSLAWSDQSKAVFMVALDTGQVLANAVFDASNAVGSDQMVFSLPSQPGVLDLDNDRFADLVVIGDAGGRVWKWDVSVLGVDGDADDVIDNWPFGVFFHAEPEDMGGGEFRFKSFFYPPSAAYVNGQLTYAFGTGERNDLLYPGDAANDENNRFYVIRDPDPVGASALPATPYTEADLTDITAVSVDADPSDLGFVFVVPDSEKFVTDVLIFAGKAIAASFTPDNSAACGPGEAVLYAFDLRDGLGFFDDDATPHADDRRLSVGTGIPSTPRISVGPSPSDDIGFINTSDKKVITFDPPLRDDPDSSFLYWLQKF